MSFPSIRGKQFVVNVCFVSFSMVFRVIFGLHVLVGVLS